MKWVEFDFGSMQGLEGKVELRPGIVLTSGFAPLPSLPLLFELCVTEQSYLGSGVGRPRYKSGSVPFQPGVKSLQLSGLQTPHL